MTLTDLTEIRNVLAELGRLDLLPSDVTQPSCDRLNVRLWTEVAYRDADGTPVAVWVIGSDLMARPGEVGEVGRWPVNEAARALGRLGGKSGRGAAKARTAEQARAAVLARWAKVKAR